MLLSHLRVIRKHHYIKQALKNHIIEGSGYKEEFWIPKNCKCGNSGMARCDGALADKIKLCSNPVGLVS